ncbi:MAG: ATP-binding protein [Candidatus Sulfotelmatobacter sp.]
MNAATPFSWSDLPANEPEKSGFRTIFECAPLAAACCNPQGVIVEMNHHFVRALEPHLANQPRLLVYDLIPAEERDRTRSLLGALLDSSCESIRIEGKRRLADELAAINWTAWRVSTRGENPPHALLIADPNSELPPVDERSLQTQRWEAVGRLAGGVVHDFNNLLTGVMLYCDLLLSSLDARDCRRRYADEIRSAIVQATGLVNQLLVFSRPEASQVRAVCLNQIAQAMRDLLTRLIGENINLEFRLSPDLGLVKIDQAQAQQVVLNLVLNARDALANGGQIVVETSNCKFQTVAGSMLARSTSAAFPCVLLVVADNGCGMDAKTRQRLFDPFFTTKSAGQGTGLGLTTVRSIVTTNRGLIHIESEPGHGTQAMILLPRATGSNDTDFAPSPNTRPISPLEVKKESLI